MAVVDVLAGVDVGTTSVKVLLMKPDGTEVARGRAATPWSETPEGVETDAYAVANAAVLALRNAVETTDGGVRVTAIGVASMGEAGVLVDGRDRPLAPVIAWHDSRDQAQLADLEVTLGGGRFSLRTGLPLWTQWALTKHRWLLDNVPAVAAAVRRYNIAEWVVRELGGDPASELSLTSRTGWLDLASGTPWEEALDWSGANHRLLGDLVTAGTPLGVVRADHPIEEIRGATLTVGGHDHQAAAIGASAYADNAELDSCGTAEALVRTIKPGLPDVALAALTDSGVTVGWHAVADRWCVLGATQGGLVLQQVMDQLGVDRNGLAALDGAALAATAGATFLTWWGPADFTVVGSLAPGDVWRAATAAVTEQARQLSNSISAHTGERGALVVAGGWSHSSALMAAKTAALGALVRSRAGEAGARGAALLGGVAHGTYPSLADAPPAPTTVIPA